MEEVAVKAADTIVEKNKKQKQTAKSLLLALQQQLMNSRSHRIIIIHNNLVEWEACLLHASFFPCKSSQNASIILPSNCLNAKLLKIVSNEGSC